MFSFLSFLAIPWDYSTVMTLLNCRDKIHTFLQHLKSSNHQSNRLWGYLFSRILYRSPGRQGKSTLLLKEIPRPKSKCFVWLHYWASLTAPNMPRHWYFILIPVKSHHHQVDEHVQSSSTSEYTAAAFEVFCKGFLSNGESVTIEMCQGAKSLTD